MKKLFVILALLILLCDCTSSLALSSSITAATTPVPGDWSTPNFTVSVKSKKVYNNHVGNKWGHAFTVGGINVKNNTKVYVDPNCGIAILSEFEEQDKYPDYGQKYEVYIPNEEEMTKGFTVVQQVIVTEDRGRYAGNDALWEVSYKFNPIRSSKRK